MLLVILLLAVGLRFWQLPQFPRGIAHDEVAEVLIARGILNGHHALFFQEAYGQEPLFLYLVAGAMAFLGQNVLALRFVSASIGLLTVAAGARLARRLFDPQVALVTAAGLGIMLWPVFWSRVGLRGMTLSLVMCLGFDALWRAIYAPSRATRYALLSGLWLGLSAYTYLASRGLPILLAVFLLYLLLFDRSLLRENWQSFVLSFGLAALIALPLVVYLRQNPDLQYRVYEVNLPLDALRQGNLRPVLENALHVLGMFSLQGDFTVRNNFPYRPVFPGLLWGAFFYAGLLVSLRRLCEPRYGLLLLWLGVMLSPSIVTTEAPNFVRTLGALPVVMLLPGIGVSWLSQQLCDWRPKLLRLLCVCLGLMVVIHTGLTIRDYFMRWPVLEETQFVWQEDLLSVAQYLDTTPDLDSVTVAGLSNTSMDAPTLDLLLRRQDLKIRWTDTGSPLGTGGAIVVPAEGGSLLIPDIVPLNPLLAGYLGRLGYEPELMGRFTRYLLPPYDVDDYTAVRFLYKPGNALEGDIFEGGVTLLSVMQFSSELKSNEPLVLLSAWQVLDTPSAPLKVFVHLVDADGNLLTQHDGLDSPSQFWQPGDVVLQTHTVSLPPDLASGPYTLRLGLYNPDTLVPYRLLDGRDFVDLGRLMIEDGN